MLTSISEKNECHSSRLVIAPTSFIVDKDLLWRLLDVSMTLTFQCLKLSFVETTKFTFSRLYKNTIFLRDSASFRFRQHRVDIVSMLCYMSRVAWAHLIILANAQQEE